MHKIYYTNENIAGFTNDIIRQLVQGKWKPDYVVGLTRGGLVPALYISHYLDIPMHTLKVSLRDDSNGAESNLWMAEDAFYGKNILIVDDINDSGATLQWIKKDWPCGVFPSDERWNHIWNNTVRFAVLVGNEASEFKEVDYASEIINKLEKNVWCVFPWETWWLSKNN